MSVQTDPFLDLRTDAGECPDCKGEGVIYTRHRDDGRPSHAKRCKCMVSLSNARRMSKVNRELPASFRNMSFDRTPLKDIPPAATAKLKAYLRDPAARVRDGHGLWLGGETGTAKTAAACLVIQRAREAGIGAEFWSVPELLVRLARTRYDENYSGDEEDLHVLLADVPVLCLDDLSAGKVTPWALEQIYVIVNRRYNIGPGRATLVTTDQDAARLARKFSGRTIRRLQDMTHEVNFDWPAAATARAA